MFCFIIFVLLSLFSELSLYNSQHAMAPEEDWVVHIREELQRNKPSESLVVPSIFMVSSPLRGLKLEAFIPQVVAIGPYHCDIGPHHSDFPETAESQRYKMMAAKDMERHKIIVATDTAKKCKLTGDFFSIVNEFLKMIDRVKEQYDSDLGWKSDEKLALLMALDAAFVVEILESLVEMGSISPSGSMYASRFARPLRKSILQDFILLENQIPLFLVTKIIRMQGKCRSDDDADRLLDAMIYKLACEILPFASINKESFSEKNMSRCKHLLDCLYRLVTFPNGPPVKNTEIVERPMHSPRAVELANAGLKFRPTQGNVMDVSFDSKSAILYLPKMRVGDDTDKLFRNLIAYESHMIDEVGVLSYLRFMNNLVDTPEDVALLVAKGILAQDIGSNEEVAHMFNNLCDNTMRVWSRHYEDISIALNKHRNFKLNVLKAEFKAQYLARPWLVVSLASGAALLIMTFVIMYYTILLYRKEG